jgi:hypothetical protein
MAPPVKTVGSLVSDIAEIVANTASPQTSYANQIKAAAQFALMELVNKTRPSWLHRESGTPITTADGTSDYTLADDFFMMVDTAGVWCTAAPFAVLQYMTMQDWVANRGHDTSRKSDPPTHYCLPHSDVSTGAQIIRLYPTPSTVRTLKYRYIATPAAIDAAADSTNLDVRIPPSMHHVLVWGAVANLPGLMNDPQRLALYESRWRSALSDTKAASNRIIGAQRQRARYDAGRGISRLDPAPTIDGTAAP